MNQFNIPETEEELLAEIGRALADEEGIGPLPVREYVRRATNWLEQKQAELADTICLDETVRRWFEKRDDALLTVLATLINVKCAPVPAGTVSKLLVKMGIDNICRNRWNEDA